MVRDEADVVGAMLEHHRQQGIFKAIVTDNGSVDGTLDILQQFEDEGFVDLRQDPVHKKQQGQRVTEMARDAYSIYGADWVINADADEFWVAENPNLTIGDVCSSFDPAWQSFNVPVLDMTGPPAKSGTGLSRLSWVDLRSTQELNAVGIFAHSTHDCIHIGNPDVVVSQGNHFVSLPSLGSPEDGRGLQVLHYQWRSWEQFSRKVENAGKAYLANPHLTPSPRHHGMKDFKRLQSGYLESIYLARHPNSLELSNSTSFQKINENYGIPESPIRDENYSEDELNLKRSFGLTIANLEQEIDRLGEELSNTEHSVKELQYELQGQTEQLNRALNDLRNPLRYVFRVAQGLYRRLSFLKQKNAPPQ